jgi:hypothetical protein
MSSVLRLGRETTMMAVHISAVHHASAVKSIYFARAEVGWTCNEHDKPRGRLTTRRIVDAVVCYCVGDEPGETDDHGDEAEGKDADEAKLLPPAELEAVDDEKRKAKDW